MEYRLTDFLPTTKKELELRGWDEVDVILFSGDAYVDHPSFGAAVIGRTLEAAGYISTPLIDVCAQKMPTAPMGATTSVLSTPPSSIPTF